MRMQKRWNKFEKDSLAPFWNITSRIKNIDSGLYIQQLLKTLADWMQQYITGTEVCVCMCVYQVGVMPGIPA